MRVLITRERAQPLAGLLQERGLVVVHVPLVALHPTGDSPPAGCPDVVLVTSVAGVRFATNLPRLIAGARVCAVGQVTAAALRKAGIEVAMVGDAGGLEALRMLDIQPGQRAWYVGAQEPSEDLGKELSRMGLQRWSVYRNDTPADCAEKLRLADYDCIAFTSGSAVRTFVGICGVPDKPVFVLGPSTSKVANSVGLSVLGTAAAPTMEALADVLGAVVLSG